MRLLSIQRFLGHTSRCYLPRFKSRSNYNRRQPIGNFWRSFEMYTDLPPTDERRNSLIRRRLLENVIKGLKLGIVQTWPIKLTFNLYCFRKGNKWRCPI
jgi:hypothetical protein